jgi:hypothetical protein
MLVSGFAAASEADPDSKDGDFFSLARLSRTLILCS